MDHVSVVAVRLIHLCTSSWCTVEIIFLTFLSFLVSFYLFLSFLLVFFVVLVFFLSFVCFLFTYFGLCCFFLLSIYCCYFFICCCLISRTSGHQYLSVLQAPVSWSAPSYFFCRFAGQWEGIFVFIFFFCHHRHQPPPSPLSLLLPLASPLCHLPFIFSERSCCPAVSRLNPPTTSLLDSWQPAFYNHLSLHLPEVPG